MCLGDTSNIWLLPIRNYLEERFESHAKYFRISKHLRTAFVFKVPTTFRQCLWNNFRYIFHIEFAVSDDFLLPSHTRKSYREGYQILRLKTIILKPFHIPPILKSINFYLCVNSSTLSLVSLNYLKIVHCLKNWCHICH